MPSEAAISHDLSPVIPHPSIYPDGSFSHKGKGIKILIVALFLTTTIMTKTGNKLNVLQKEMGK